MSEPVRAIQRALRLMRIMNNREIWTLQSLAEASCLAKPTVHRLLATLEKEGYVHAFSGLPGLYRLTARTQELSAGLTSFTILADAAEPIVIQATLELSWPISFAMPEPPFMRSVACGMPYVPAHSAKPTSVEKRLWIFSSAVGKAYLSNCSEDEIAQICDAAASFCRASDVALPVPSVKEATDAAALVRETGWATRVATRAELNSAVAVPVFSGSRTLGGLACTTFPRSLSAGFIQATLGPLTRAAEQIYEACASATLRHDDAVAADAVSDPAHPYRDAIAEAPFLLS